jgi:ribose transport system substrate-binding protein
VALVQDQRQRGESERTSNSISLKDEFSEKEDCRVFRKRQTAILRRSLATFAIAALGAGVAACSSSPSSSNAGNSNNSSSKSYTIALLNGDNEDPYFYSVWAGALAEAKKYNATITEQAPPTFDYTSQVPLFEDMLAKHVSAIILSADGTGTTFNGPLAQAKAAGIPVIIVNETEGDMDNTPYSLSFITSSNTALSAQAGQEACALLNGKGTVGILNSSVTVISDLQRVTGFQSYVSAHCPGLTLLPQQVSGDDVSKADSLATDLIESHPNLSLIYAVDDFNAVGVLTALKDAHDTGKIKEVAIDAEPAEVSALKEGDIQALVAQQPYNVGETSVEYAMDALTGHTSDIVRSVSPLGIVLTQANINDPQYADVPYSPTIP